MSIIYGLVAKDKTVLAEYTEFGGNFSNIARLLLEIIPPHSSRKSYIYNDYVFHQLMKNGITFMAMTDRELGFLIPYSFLEEVSKIFFKHFNYTSDFITLSLDEEFKSVLKENMRKFNDYEANEVHNLKSQISNIQNIIIENIEKILERREKIDILVNRSEKLRQENFNFRREAIRLNFYMWMENNRFLIYVISSMAIFVLVIWSIYNV
ncbi:SNARE protein, putative [Plasmodium chabaudi chabaudi]|uniref:SNARE protein, putative n=3 Tax=Plasmodium (Vinckeia) TaxID=418101 RepID=A0A077TU33_PLACU|nr:SNARE protein, putative [Plasmodium vinckei vinckei]XP_016654809.1 SNARE protein, putative [Plasmodium chabaudi chabaudi]SCM13526.1 SNARE protein, putative [Plasmodium chabaudi adami]KEG04405.1 vesicle-associated membrane protein 7 [Plasmodium vinckei vinckei]SCM24337.1 SNARE protein, putative [Plasmodium chabaudi adami]SCM25835.1 SNARE protein, putative [Plasmodium chabaudi chabaudi]SCN62590.1 SNARE protein, putative [Plasmodium chabaudi chabaudi]|eukprot:XP_016654809.1 SNARE protein, putative [Plasmodium chabaudi chabaudi]